MTTITLCGSTRFRDKFIEVNVQLSKRGHVVYSVALYANAGEEISKEDKLVLDAVHMAKIANSDAILVINPGGYIGESTEREIYFAIAMGKKVRFLESWENNLRFNNTNFRSESRPCPPI